MNQTMYGKIVAIALLLMVAMPMLPAVAQDDIGIATDTVEEVVEEVADDVGILPTSPFYFFKEWGRGFRRAFIFDPVKRAEFELRITDEKAEELEEVSEVDGEDEEGIDRAARNYEEAVVRLRTRLEKVEENSENPNVQKLLENLADRTVEHQELIARLRARFEQFENLRLRLQQTRESVEGVIDSVKGGVEAVGELRGRLRTGDVELRVELKEKLKEFRQGVESSGVFDRLGGFESEMRSRVENRTDGLRERLEFRERINGEETRFRFENRLDTDNGDEVEDADDDEDLDEEDEDDEVEDTDGNSEDLDEDGDDNEEDLDEDESGDEDDDDENDEDEDLDEDEGEEDRGGGGGGGGTSKNKKTTEDITDTDTMTLAQLRVELDRLIALLAQLQAAATANSEVGELTRNLGVGSIGEDVRMLQRYLNNHGFVLAISGPAAPGSETTFFGELTRATLARFQAANDITPAVGFFGPITRMYINAHP